MPPSPTNATPVPAPPAAGTGAPKPRRGWSAISRGASARAKIVTFLIALVVAGAGIGFLIGHLLKPAAKSVQPGSTTVQNLSPDEIAKLGQLGTSLGSQGQVLTVGADSIFKGKVDIGGDLNLNGHFNANGPVSLQSINSSGSSNFGVVTIGQGLQVGGAATVQGGINAQSFLNVNGSMNVNGNTSLGAVTAASLTVHNLTVLGPLAIAHLVSSGPAPSITWTSNVGSGGTANISGNDTAGVININLGSSPASGPLATITFRASYGGRAHVILTPASCVAGASQVYTQPTAQAFSIVSNNISTSGCGSNRTMTYDYIVVQ